MSIKALAVEWVYVVKASDKMEKTLDKMNRRYKKHKKLNMNEI